MQQKHELFVPNLFTSISNIPTSDIIPKNVTENINKIAILLTVFIPSLINTAIKAAIIGIVINNIIGIDFSLKSKKITKNNIKNPTIAKFIKYLS